MNFFLDENFPKSAMKILEDHNHKVFDVRGTENEGSTDEDIFKLAQLKNSVFLTTDKDFYHTIHFRHPFHNGIVIIALSTPSGKKILEKLKWFLNYFPDNHSGKCYLILDNKCKIY